MPESAQAPGPRPQAPITAAQRRALFASANQRGLSLDELRAMTPQRSVSQLSAHEAATILQRLNGGSRITASPRRPRRPRRPSNVIALISAEQRALIVAIRMEIGWTDAELHDWLTKRHHPDGRPMNVMHSSSDAVAVIELLKGVRTRTFLARWRKKSNIAGPARCHAGATRIEAPPPIDHRQIWTIRDRIARIARIARARGQSSQQVREWAYTLRLRSGRLARGIADSAEASELIELLTRELANLKSKEPAT